MNLRYWKRATRVQQGVKRIVLTPVVKEEGIYLKRDDLFSVAGISGGKARTCWHLAQDANGLVTAGSRHSPQVNIVAHIAEHLEIPCRVHIPTGQLLPELLDAREHGTEIIQHKAGYNNVIVARAREDASERGWVNIPFGMECAEAVNQTLVQTNNIPREAKRIVVPIGSGMSLSGILTGMVANGIRIPVVGIQVGADPIKRLYKFAPLFWQTMVTIVKSKYKYEDHVYAKVGNVILDPIYEAKCVEHLKEGDLLWIVGKRKA